MRRTATRPAAAPLGLLVLAIATLWMLAGPGAGGADAKRAATQAEAAAIATALGEDTACLRVRVSTVNPTWAVADKKVSRGCYSESSFSMVRRRHGRWEYLFAGGLGGAPGDCGDPMIGASELHVPTKVAIDLGLCKPSPPQMPGTSSVLCEQPINPEIDDPELPIVGAEREPAACSMRFGDSPSSGPNLSGLTWTGWGTRRARASGIDVGFDPAAPTAIPVRLAAWRPRVNDCPGYTYTRITIRWADHSVVLRRPARCVL